MEGKDGRTERATPRKRSKEREEGKVCLSPEITSMLALLLGVIALRLSAPMMFRRWAILFMELTRFERLGEWTARDAGEAFGEGAVFVWSLMSPLLLVLMGAAIVSNMAQTKPFFSMKTLKWKWSSLNPVKGVTKLFSMESLVKLGITLLKLMVLSAVVFLYTRRQWPVVTSLHRYSVPDSAVWMFSFVFRIAILVACLHVVIAAIDWAHKKYQHEKGMMMTKDEVKDERKQEETSPMVKRAQMKKMRELTLSRMIAAVPQASVVIANPTHVAIALQYEPDKMSAPKVTAKGLDFLAQRIKKIAAEHNVPIVERPETARALYKHVEVGQEIPAKFYEAVAAILAFLHKLGKGIAV